jgi:hypothetical protein
MPPDPDPTGRVPGSPLLAEAAIRFQTVVAHIEFRRLVERAQRRREEDRRRREVADLLFFAQMVGDADVN